MSNRGISNIAKQDGGYIELTFDTPYEKPPSCVASQAFSATESQSYQLDASISSTNECAFQLGVNAVLRGLSTTKVGLETGRLTGPTGSGAVPESALQAFSVICIGVPQAKAATTSSPAVLPEGGGSLETEKREVGKWKAMYEKQLSLNKPIQPRTVNAVDGDDLEAKTVLELEEMLKEKKHRMVEQLRA